MMEHCLLFLILFFQVSLLFFLCQDLDGKGIIPYLLHKCFNKNYLNNNWLPKYTFFKIYITITSLKLYIHIKILIRLIYFKYSNLENKAVSSPIWMIILWVGYLCWKWFYYQSNSQYNKDNYEMLTVLFLKYVHGFTVNLIYTRLALSQLNQLLPMIECNLLSAHQIHTTKYYNLHVPDWAPHLLRVELYIYNIYIYIYIYI